MDVVSNTVRNQKLRLKKKNPKGRLCKGKAIFHEGTGVKDLRKKGSDKMTNLLREDERKGVRIRGILSEFGLEKKMKKMPASKSSRGEGTQ